MTDKTKSLREITNIIANDIFRQYWSWYPYGISEDDEDRIWYLLNVIASLHNLLYESETGERYDYMFHWANKCGGDCSDNIFDKDYEEEE